MSLDAALTALAVGAAALWLARRAWRAFRGRAHGRGCGGGCGCAETKLGRRP